MDPRGLRPLGAGCLRAAFGSGQGACYGDGGSELRGNCFDREEVFAWEKVRIFGGQAGMPVLHGVVSFLARCSHATAFAILRRCSAKPFSITSAIRAMPESCPMPPPRWRSIIPFAGTSSSWLRELSGDVLRRSAFFAGVAQHRLLARLS